jgi:hypothetical protein
MKIGTCFFRSRRDAIRYYRSQGYDLTAYEMHNEIERKIRDGEISIGNPPPKELYVVKWDADGLAYYELDDNMPVIHFPKDFNPTHSRAFRVGDTQYAQYVAWARTKKEIDPNYGAPSFEDWKRDYQ